MTYLRCIPLCFGPGGGTPSLFYAQFPRNVRLDRVGKARGIFPRKLIRLVSGLLKKSKFTENARSSKRGITVPDDNLKQFFVLVRKTAAVGLGCS